MSEELPEIPPTIFGAVAGDEVAELESHLFGDLATPANVTAARIVSVPAAAWAVARIAEAQKGIDDIHTMAASWRAEINRYEEAATEWSRRVIDLLRPKVEAYALSVREESPRDRKGEPTVKTVKLPNGEVRTSGREVGQTAVTDEPALLVWLRANLPDGIKTTEKPIIPTIKAAASVRFVEGAVYGSLVTVDGEEIPGIVVERGTITATVVPS